MNNENTSQGSGEVRIKSTSNEVLGPVVNWVRSETNETGSYSILRYVDLDGQLQKLDYKHLTEKDPYPLPLPVDREGYCSIEQSAQYWATGHGDWINVQEAINRFAKRAPRRIFDFGCATGRFLRHVHLFGGLETHGSDLAPANVDWVGKYLPEPINVVANTTDPELPYDDNFFDVVTAFSVFSHIDDGANEWLAELSRITHPDGVLYLTIQNQAAWSAVNDRPGSLEHLQKANSVPGNIFVSKDLFDGSMPSERIVFRMSQDNTYNRNVWLTNDYVREHWSQMFDVLMIADNAHTCFQAPVIMRTRNG